MELRHGLAWLLLVGGAVLSAWFVALVNRESPPQVIRHIPDYDITDLTAREYDAAGRLYYYLYAHQMKHYPDDESTDLTELYAIFFDQGNALWQLQASQGMVSKDGQQVILSHGVLLERNATAVSPRMTLTTPSLTVYPRQREAETSDPVKLTHDHDIITATGLQANFLAQGQVKLLNQVKGTYAPR